MPLDATDLWNAMQRPVESVQMSVTDIRYTTNTIWEATGLTLFLSPGDYILKLEVQHINQPHFRLFDVSTATVVAFRDGAGEWIPMIDSGYEATPDFLFQATTRAQLEVQWRASMGTAQLDNATLTAHPYNAIKTTPIFIKLPDPEPPTAWERMLDDDYL